MCFVIYILLPLIFPQILLSHVTLTTDSLLRLSPSFVTANILGIDWGFFCWFVFEIQKTNSIGVVVNSGYLWLWFQVIEVVREPNLQIYVIFYCGCTTLTFDLFVSSPTLWFWFMDLITWNTVTGGGFQRRRSGLNGWEVGINKTVI